MEKIVCTMPAKPKEDIKISLEISPILSEFIGNALNYKKVLTVNTLNTYKNNDPYLKNYLEKLQNDGIEYDFLYNDKEYSNEILKKIYQMLDEKIITETTDELIRCDCGKVDILKRAISEHYDGQLYKVDNGKIICKHCNCVCKQSKEKILKIDVEKHKIKPIKIAPIYLNKVVNGIENDMSDNYLVISKKRDTGCTINYNNTNYNIDIDFIWLLLLQIIPSDRKIYVAGNRQITKMFNLNYINSLTDNQDIYFVGNPYLYLEENELNNCNFTEEEDNLIRKITILCNLKWKKNNNIFSSSIYKYVRSISIQQRYKLYEQMLRTFENIDNKIPFEVYLEKILIESSNIQKNMSKILKI